MNSIDRRLRRVLLGALAMLATVGSLLMAAPAQAADYPAGIETTCDVQVAVVPASDYDIVFTVTAAVGGVPTGTATLHVTGRPTQTLPLVNGTVRIPFANVNPNVTYTISGDYTPEASSGFRPCSASTTFALQSGVGGPTAPAGGGVLPNTGGFPLIWLWAAMLMIVTGSALIAMGNHDLRKTASRQRARYGL